MDLLEARPPPFETATYEYYIPVVCSWVKPSLLNRADILYTFRIEQNKGFMQQRFAEKWTDPSPSSIYAVIPPWQMSWNNNQVFRSHIC